MIASTIKMDKNLSRSPPTRKNKNLLNCRGFDLDEPFRSRQAVYTEQRTGIAGSGAHKAFHDHIAIREKTFQVGCVEIQSDQIRNAVSCPCEHLLEIVDRAIELSPEVAGMDRFAICVDGDLTGTIEDALATGHFVPLHESESVLPFRWVDDFPVQIFLPGQSVSDL